MRCRSCNAPIRFVVSEKTGRSMPIDMAKPPAGGNVHDTGRVDARGTMIVVVRAHPEPGGWVAHFATCPNAKGHRRTP